MFPWYAPTKTVSANPAADALRLEVRGLQDMECQNLRLVNEFLRAEIEKSKRSESRLLKKAAGAGGSG